jgi:predicted nucleic-acid-binding protein
MMIGLDTNILVRLFVMDDSRQAEKAAAFIRRAGSEERKCFINLVVLCELVWVLESAYEYGKSEIAGLLEKMLMIKQFDIDSKDIVRQATHDYRHGNADFADYLVGRINKHKGCKQTATFDKALKGSGFFEVLS